MAAKPSTALHCRAVLESPLPGGLHIALSFHGDRLASIDFVDAATAPFCEADPAVEKAAQAIKHYFNSRDRAIMPLSRLSLSGTPFQLRVWLALREIPFGETCSYGTLAAQLHSSARAVAGACRANPLPLLIPCHRVVSAKGPGGYMGQTDGLALAIKNWLLHHEQYAR